MEEEETRLKISKEELIAFLWGMIAGAILLAIIINL